MKKFIYATTNEDNKMKGSPIIEKGTNKPNPSQLFGASQDITETKKIAGIKTKLAIVKIVPAVMYNMQKYFEKLCIQIQQKAMQFSQLELF